MSRMTRSASAASGTFSTKLVFTFPAKAASASFRALSWAKVQPASPTGPTYANATFNGPVALASAAAGAGVAAEGAGAGAASLLVFLLQAGRAAQTIASSDMDTVCVRQVGRRARANERGM